MSINLVLLSLILILLPANANKKGEIKPTEQVLLLDSDDQMVGIELAARYVAENNSDVQFIDLRSSDEFQICNIPGSINIPFEQLFEQKWQSYFNQSQKVNILYSNGNSKSSMAFALLSSQNPLTIKMLKGGLNEWYAKVMNAEFKGGRLSAKENAIFENKSRAKTLFIELNSLPDSAKNAFIELKLLEEKKLDGGCE